MAQVQRIYSPAPNALSAAARGVPTTRVSSAISSPITESNPSTAAFFDTAPFSLQDQSYSQQGFREGRSQQRQPSGSLLNIASETFSILLENNGGSIEDAGLPGEVLGRRYTGSVSNAIKTYETNARVIHGKPPVTGTQISIRL